MRGSGKARCGDVRARGAAVSRSLVLALVGALLGVTLLVGCASSDPGEQPANDAASAQQEPAAEIEQHELSFVVDAEGSDLPASVGILVTGTQGDGVKVDDRYEAALGKMYATAYPEGSYAFDVDSASLKLGEEIFAAVHVAYAFDGSADHTVHIKLVRDAEAMAEAQAAKEQAAAAAAAAVEEEAAAAAAAAEEEAAAAVAEQEAAAAAAAASAGGGGGDTVYITKTGEKFHRDGCRYLKKSQIAISRSDAVAQGYGACSVCNP